jgi:hypothetical protein
MAIRLLPFGAVSLPHVVCYQEEVRALSLGSTDHLISAASLPQGGLLLDGA